MKRLILFLALSAGIVLAESSSGGTKNVNSRIVDAGSNTNAVNVTDGAMEVLPQDQITEPIDDYFLQELSSFTLASNAISSTATVLVYTVTATTGHGIADGDEILLLDVAADRSFYAQVIDVTGDTIEIDRPVDHAFPTASTLGKIVNSNMAVDGSTTEQIFTLRAGTTPIDITRVLPTILGGSTAMDDGKFGNIAALERGLVFRIVNGFQKTIFNFKTNNDIKQFCFDMNYSDNAPAGNTGASARITFNGPSKHGVPLRISGSSVLQFIVQDDLTALVLVRGVGEGHKTSGEL